MSEMIGSISTKVKIASLNLWIIIGYSTGYFGYGFVTQMMTTYLVFYATVVLNIPGGLIGLIIAISILWDAVSDPLMGYISDMTVSKFGRRHVYIIIGTIGIAITNLMLWNVRIDISMEYKFIWILLAVLLIKTFVTIFVTPYSALGAELSNDYDERTIIQGTKTVFYLSSFVIVTAVCMFIYFRPTDMYPLGQLNPSAYRKISILSSLLMLGTGFLAYLSTKKFIPQLQKTKTEATQFHFSEFISSLKFCMTLDNYRHIFFGFLFTNLASAVISAVGLHTFTYTFQMNNYEIGIVLGIQFLVCIVAQPFWIKIAAKSGKIYAVNLGLKISIVGCLTLLVFTFMKGQVVMNFEYLLIYSVIIGFGTSGLFSIPLSMVADTVDEQEYITGDRNEGLYYGMINFGYKISQSIAIIVLGIFLDIIRFDSSLPFQESYTTTLLGVILSVASMLTFILATIAYKKYNVDKERIEFIQAEIKRRWT